MGLVGLLGSSESPYPLCKGGAYRGSGLPDVVGRDSRHLLTGLSSLRD